MQHRKKVECILSSVLLVVLLIPMGLSQETCSYNLTIPHDQAITININYNSPDSYFIMNLTSVPEPWDIDTGFYQGWCVQRSELISKNVDHGVYLCPSTAITDNFSAFALVPWEKINYLLNHKDLVNNDADLIQKTIWNITDNLSTTNSTVLSALADINANAEFFCPEEGQLLAILVKSGDGTVNPQRTILELTLPTTTPDDPDDPPRRGGGGGNNPPTADAQAGEPYIGLINEDIIFDGSLSYDVDGTIISYIWDFGDGATGTGRTTTHQYQTPGIYPVTLTVKDNDAAKNTYTTTAEIIVLNQPPSTPNIQGTTECSSNVSYEYTFTSYDLDNDTLRYILDWGDETDYISDFVANNTALSRSHTWQEAGLYLLKTYAEDSNNAPSQTNQQFIFVDVEVIFIDDVIKGYLIDYGKDGTYDEFHNNQTGTDTPLIVEGDGWYLIDSDNDTISEYRYHPSHGLSEIAEQTTNEYLVPMLILIALLIVIAVGLLIFIRLNKKK